MIRAYKYGCPWWADQRGTAFRYQLMLSSHLWNELVTIERQHSEDVARVWAEHPGTASQVLSVQQELSELARLRRQSAAERAEDRTTRIRQGTATLIADTKRNLGEASAKLSAAKEAEYPVLEEKFRKLAQSCRACTCRLSKPENSLYKQYRAYGLGWGTVNDILQRRYPVAVKAVKASPGAQLRYTRLDGTGTLTVQLQSGRGKMKDVPPVVSAFGALCRDDGPWASACRIERREWQPSGTSRHHLQKPPSARRAAQLYTLHLSVDRDCRISLPFIMHRPLPDGAVVREVKITRRRTGYTYRMSVSLVVYIPDPVPVTSGPGIAVRMHWNAEDDGAVRIARISSLEPFPDVPAEIAGHVSLSPSRRDADICTDPGWREVLEKDDDIRSGRDRNLAAVIASLQASTTSTPDLREITGDVSHWRSAERVRDLLSHHGKEIRELDPALHAQLTWWKLTDIALRNHEMHEREQVAACMKDRYRKLAAWLCSTAGNILIQGTDISRMRERDADAEDSFAARRGREQIQAAAPGMFRQLLIQAADARGIPVQLAEDEYEKTR